MKYEQGTEGEADYYTNNKSVTIDATETKPEMAQPQLTLLLKLKQIGLKKSLKIFAQQQSGM